MKLNVVAYSALCILMVSTGVTQQHGRPSGGGNMQQRGQSTPGGQRGLGDQTQSQDRLRIHANDQQQMQSRTCTQSMQQVRNRLRTMSRISSTQTVTSEQAKQWRKQLRSEVQTMDREQQALMNGLSPEQKNAVQDRAQNMQMSRQQFDSMLEALDMELALESPDSSRVRQKSRDAESAMNKFRYQQQEFNNLLGIE